VLAAVLAAVAAPAAGKRHGGKARTFCGTGHFVYTLKQRFFTPST
jgi:hypothetical protein